MLYRLLYDQETYELGFWRDCKWCSWEWVHETFTRGDMELAGSIINWAMNPHDNSCKKGKTETKEIQTSWNKEAREDEGSPTLSVPTTSMKLECWERRWDEKWTFVCQSEEQWPRTSCAHFCDVLLSLVQLAERASKGCLGRTVWLPSAVLCRLISLFHIHREAMPRQVCQQPRPETGTGDGDGKI